MKFAIFREIELSSGKKKRKIYVEWDADRIKQALYNKVEKNVGLNGAEGFSSAWDETIKEFKKESIKIP